VNPNKPARANPVVEGDSEADGAAYEAPNLVEVGNLRELLGKSGPDIDNSPTNETRP